MNMNIIALWFHFKCLLLAAASDSCHLRRICSYNAIS